MDSVSVDGIFQVGLGSELSRWNLEALTILEYMCIWCLPPLASTISQVWPEAIGPVLRPEGRNARQDRKHRTHDRHQSPSSMVSSQGPEHWW